MVLLAWTVRRAAASIAVSLLGAALLTAAAPITPTPHIAPRLADYSGDYYAWVATTDGYLELDDATTGSIVESIPIAVPGKNTMNLEGFDPEGANNVGVSPSGQWIFLDASVYPDSNSTPDAELAFNPGTNQVIQLYIPDFLFSTQTLFSSNGQTAYIVYWTEDGGSADIAVVSLLGQPSLVNILPISTSEYSYWLTNGTDVALSSDGSTLYYTPGWEWSDEPDPQLVAISTTTGEQTTVPLQSPCSSGCASGNWRVCNIATTDDPAAPNTLLASYMAYDGSGDTQLGGTGGPPDFDPQYWDWGTAEFDLSTGAVLNVQSGFNGCDNWYSTIAAQPGTTQGIASEDLELADGRYDSQRLSRNSAQRDQEGDGSASRRSRSLAWAAHTKPAVTTGLRS